MSMTLREKILVGAALATVILGIIYHYWYQPTQLKLSELTNQIEIYETELNRFQNKSDNYHNGLDSTDTFQSLPEMQRQLTEQVPYREAVPELIIHLHTWAGQTGTTLTGFGLEKKTTDSRYTTSAYRLQVYGGFTEICEFVRRLEQSKRLIRIEEINLTSGDSSLGTAISQLEPATASGLESSSSAKSNSLKAEIRFSTYIDTAPDAK